MLTSKRPAPCIKGFKRKAATSSVHTNETLGESDFVVYDQTTA